jgi:hypothetical protein
VDGQQVPHVGAMLDMGGKANQARGALPDDHADAPPS